MHFYQNDNALYDREVDKPSRKKPMFPVSEHLRHYLKYHGREVKLPVSYRDLLRFTYSVSLKDKFGNSTLWETVVYDMREWDYLREGLVKIYAILKTEGDLTFTNTWMYQEWITAHLAIQIHSESE